MTLILIISPEGLQCMRAWELQWFCTYHGQPAVILYVRAYSCSKYVIMLHIMIIIIYKQKIIKCIIYYTLLNMHALHVCAQRPSEEGHNNWDVYMYMQVRYSLITARCCGIIYFLFERYCPPPWERGEISIRSHSHNQIIYNRNIRNKNILIYKTLIVLDRTWFVKCHIHSLTF